MSDREACYCDEPRDFPQEPHYHFSGVFEVTAADIRDRPLDPETVAQLDAERVLRREVHGRFRKRLREELERTIHRGTGSDDG